MMFCRLCGYSDDRDDCYWWEIEDKIYNAEMDTYVKWFVCSKCYDKLVIA